MFSSNLFPHLSKSNLYTIISDGELEISDNLIESLKQEVISIIGEVNIKLVASHHWENAIPKYTLKRLNLMNQFENISIIGADFNGVGAADRIKSARDYVKKIL